MRVLLPLVIVGILIAGCCGTSPTVECCSAEVDRCERGCTWGPTEADEHCLCDGVYNRCMRGGIP